MLLSEPFTATRRRTTDQLGETRREDGTTTEADRDEPAAVQFPHGRRHGEIGHDFLGISSSAATFAVVKRLLMTLRQ
jgi:hypothetical protein